MKHLPPNNAFERFVMPGGVRAPSAVVHCAPAALNASIRRQKYLEPPMQFKPIFSLVIATFLGLASVTYASDDMPWVFNAPAADGYSITLESIEPAPGTPLVRGSEMSIVASVISAFLLILRCRRR